jgi:hypothetical protein
MWSWHPKHRKIAVPWSPNFTFMRSIGTAATTLAKSTLRRCRCYYIRSFPKAHFRFLSMPLLRPIADSFDDWLATNSYARNSCKYFVSKLPHVDADLRGRRVKEVTDLTRPVLHDCGRTFSKTCPGRAPNRANTGTISGRERSDHSSPTSHSTVSGLDSDLRVWELSARNTGIRFVHCVEPQVYGAVLSPALGRKGDRAEEDPGELPRILTSPKPVNA